MSTQLDDTVIVGVAESTFKGWALRWAAEQARLEARPLTLVNASGPVSGAWRKYGSEPLPSGPADQRERGEALLGRARAVVEQAAPGLQVHQYFEVIDAGTLLTKLSTNAHLLVLGSRGRGPVRSNLLGSVGLAVVRHAGCPVVVHRPGGHPGLTHRGVIVAADATEESMPVLRFAFRQASLRRLPLRVVHYVYDVRSELVGAPMVGDLSETAELHARALAESLAGCREDHPDVHVTIDTPWGQPREGLTTLSRQAHLTVVGTHQRGVLDRLFAGSVSSSVVEHAHGPVAVVPPAR